MIQGVMSWCHVAGELEARQEVKRLRLELSKSHEEVAYLKKLLHNFDVKQKKTTHHQEKVPHVPQNDERAKRDFRKLGNQQKRKVTDFVYDEIRAMAEKRGCEAKHILAYLLR